MLTITDVDNHARIFITFFNISSFTTHIEKFGTQITNSAVFAKIFISQKWVLLIYWHCYRLRQETNWHTGMTVAKQQVQTSRCKMPNYVTASGSNSILDQLTHLRAQGIYHNGGVPTLPWSSLSCFKATPSIQATGNNMLPEECFLFCTFKFIC